MVILEIKSTPSGHRRGCYGYVFINTSIYYLSKLSLPTIYFVLFRNHFSFCTYPSASYRKENNIKSHHLTKDFIKYIIFLNTKKGKDNHTQMVPLRENTGQLRGNEHIIITYSHGKLSGPVQNVSCAGQAKRHRGKKLVSYQALTFTSCSLYTQQC